MRGVATAVCVGSSPALVSIQIIKSRAAINLIRFITPETGVRIPYHPARMIRLKVRTP